MKSTSIVFMLCLWSVCLQAQNDLFSKSPIIVSVYSHSIGLPLKSIAKQPLNIGFAIGTEFNYNRNRISSIYQRVELGWYHHKNLSTGIWMKTDLVRRFTSKDGFFGEVNIGAGYLHEFYAQETFVFENGAYQSTAKGTGTWLIGAGIGGGYQLKIEDKWLLAPFVRYETCLQFPYADLPPVLPHTLLHIGTRIQIDK